MRFVILYKLFSYKAITLIEIEIPVDSGKSEMHIPNPMELIDLNCLL